MKDSFREIGDVITGLAFSFEKEKDEESAGAIRKVTEYYEKKQDDDWYITEMHIIMDRLGDIPAKPWLAKRPHVERWDKFYVESIFNGLFQHWFGRVINVNEGSAGSADKERFVVAKMLKAIDEQTNLSLYAEYKDEPGVQAFWSPKSFRDTDEVKEAFRTWWRVADE